MKFKIKLKILLFSLLFLGLAGFLVIGTDLTLSPTTPANQTNYTTGFVDMLVSVSPASNTTNCSYEAGYTNGTVRSKIEMVNLTATNTSYGNTSAFTPEIDNTYGKWHNLTFTCNNLTAGEEFTSYIEYGYDTTDPTVDTIAETVRNQSTGGNNLSVTFNSSDVNNEACGVKISDRGNNLVSTVYGTWEENIQDRQCDVEISNSHFTQNGNYTLTPWANDTLGNSGIGTNQTYTAYQMKTGWNLVEFPYNLTLNEIASLVKDVSYVSVYDNLYKNYTTFTVGSATNSGYTANSTNATYIYVDEDVVLLQEHRTDTTNQNVTLYDMTSSGWNQIGMMHRHTLNETMYNTTEGGMAVIFNSTGDEVGDTHYSANVTWVSYYNATAGKYCSAYRGYKSTSCSPQNVTDIYVERGQALWIAVDANITYDRGVD